jgi:zinc/manganese transport system substrate-binding protein
MLLIMNRLPSVSGVDRRPDPSEEVSMNTRFLPALAAVGALALGLSACSDSADAQSASGESDGASASGSSAAIDVVASTNVWGDIASTIGGDQVEVTSIISDPDQDPHEYQASSRNQLALSSAKVVIENGGGYDDFVDTMLSASGNSSATVINAVDVSGYSASAGDELNEHVWYDYGTVGKVADAIAEALGEADPANAETFTGNASTFKEGLDTLNASVATIKEDHSGTGVAITEPVPLYLLDNMGLDNKTPEEFSEAIEEETDGPADVLKETTDLFADHAVSLLVYNEQTSGPQSDAVLTAAQDAGVPVVPVQETLPEGTDYLGWQTSIIDSISKALQG